MFASLKNNIQKYFSRYGQQIMPASIICNFILIITVLCLALLPKDPLALPRLVTDNIINKSANVPDDGFYVEILGQVKKPGVYYIRDKTLILQAIDLAGGITPDGDLMYIHKNIALSKYIEPQQKIYIPSQAEGQSVSTAQASADVISVNSASQSELEALVGVGPVTAQKIIAGRPYSKLEDLVGTRILSQSGYDKIVSQISL